MRAFRVILLAVVCAACSSPTRGNHARDAAAEAVPPKPFVPYTPPFAPPIPPSSGGAAVGGGAAATAGMPTSTGTGFAGMPSMPFPTGSGGMAGPGPAGPGTAGTAAAGQGGFRPDPDAGLPPPPPPASALCVNMNRHELPFDISHDFTSRFVLQAQPFSVIDFPNCDQSVFLDAAPTPPFDPDAGVLPDPDGGAPFTTVTGCSAFKYDPDFCVASNGGDPVVAGPVCWAGVIFTPTLAGPMGQGVCIDPGAMTIRFKARASKDGARVKFGSIREGLGATEFFLNLTRDWRSYTVMIPAGEDYDSSDVSGGVWNGFSVVLEPQDHAGGTYVCWSPT